jgi:hypothetical protein
MRGNQHEGLGDIIDESKFQQHVSSTGTCLLGCPELTCDKRPVLRPRTGNGEGGKATSIARVSASIYVDTTMPWGGGKLQRAFTDLSFIFQCLTEVAFAK